MVSDHGDLKSSSNTSQLPDTPNFSLVTTFKYMVIGSKFGINKNVAKQYIDAKHLTLFFNVTTSKTHSIDTHTLSIRPPPAQSVQIESKKIFATQTTSKT